MTKTATAATDQPSTCKCGCGETVARQFKQGHDQRLVSNLASDLVRMDVWDGRCMGILTKADVKSDQQAKIDKVSGYVRDKLSDALATKVYNAAMRAWELDKTQGARNEAKAARKAERDAKAAERAARKAEKAASPSEEAGPAAAPAERKLITKATASNDDVDAEEARIEADASANGFKPGDSVRVLIGKRKRNATVHGMNQAGKVTAIVLTTNGKETIKTDGFTIVPS
jgi:hypothetical protein